MYTPINPIIFSAAYAGAVSGMVAAGRYVSSPASEPGTYTSLSLVALAFAEAYDTAWNNAAVPCQYEALATEVCTFGSFQDRQPILTQAATEAAAWISLAEAIIAVVETGENVLTAEGIACPPWPSGSGITQLTGDVVAGPGPGSVVATMQGIQTVPVAATAPVQSAVPVYDTIAAEYDIRQLTEDDILPGFAITSFTGGSTVETGATVTNPAFTASYSSLPSSANITNTDGIDSPLVLTTPFTSGTVVGAFTRSTPVSITFTLTAHQGALVKTATQAINYEDRGFGGIGTAGATSSTASGNNAVLNGGAGTLSDSFLAANFVGTSFGPFSPVSEVIYIQLPAGVHTFEDQDGFGFPMTAVATFGFVNQEGATVPMTLWASNTLSSPFTVTVKT